uniref:Uncharacterized protein n=1 Tax=Fagus sylvatica TaxID=28930 RepID=A0A2N9G5L3_FAGSY
MVVADTMVNEISDTPIVMEEEVATKVVEEIAAEAASDVVLKLQQKFLMISQQKLLKIDHVIVAIKTEAVAAETAYGVAAEATNDVEFNESESFDGSNSSEFALKSHDFAIDYEAFFPHSKLSFGLLVVVACLVGALAGSSNEFAVEDEGNFDAVAAAESATATIQPPFASLERLCVQISAVPAEILDFFGEFDRVNVSQYRPQHFWVFGGGEIDFYGYSVPCDGVQFLEAMWKKYGNFISHFKLGIFVGGAMLTLLCCVLAQMRNTNFDDVTEAKRWKSVVLLETYLAKGIAAGITAEAAYRVVVEAADDVVAKVVDVVILEIIENASNLREIPAMGNSPQDKDCDLGRCKTADFYELLLALIGVHYSFIVASANIVMIGKECMNVVGTAKLIVDAIAEPSTTDL